MDDSHDSDDMTTPTPPSARPAENTPGQPEKTHLRLGFVALSDVAPLVAAKVLEFGHSHGLTLELCRQPSWAAVRDKLLAGELDAALHYLAGNNLVDRSRADLISHPDFKYLFPDSAAEGIRYYRKTGIFPINHQAVVRRDIYEKEPWVVLNLLKAFSKANEIVEAQRVEHAEYHLATGLLTGDARTTLLRHGVKANRKVIETIAQYSLEQGLTPRLIKVDELYAPNALDT